MGTAQGMGPDLDRLAKATEQELLDATEPPAPANTGEEPANTWGMAIGSHGSEHSRWRALARKAIWPSHVRATT
jgi:uncharacterized protein with beta-barrel porin domain